jgi:hypothetical protein
MVDRLAEKDRITLIVEGLSEDEGRVRFNAFMNQLQSLSAVLNRLDREVNAGRPASYFRIAELSYASPIRVVLEPQPLPHHPYVGRQLLENLNRVADALANGGDIAPIDADLLEEFEKLAKPVGKRIKTAALLFNDRELVLDQKVAKRIDDALAVTDECEGSVEGMLEQINLHQGANIFHVYPEIWPKKVTCRFPYRLYDDAVSAVGRRVEVFGTLRYRSGSDFPHQIAVSQIETFPPEHELPDWDDLRGRAPDALGGLSSEAFVRELRDGWR